MIISSVAAILLAAVSIKCLNQSQQAAVISRRFLVTAGCFAFGASLLLWINSIGLEFGVACGLMFPALVAWLLIYWRADVKTAKPEPSKAHRKTAISANKVLINTGYFGFLVPLLAVFSSLISLAISYWLPFQEINQLALSLVLQPLLWAVFSVWFFIDRYRFRPPAITGLLAALSAVALFSHF